VATDMGGFAQAGGPLLIDRFSRPLNAAGVFMPFSRTDTLIASARWAAIMLGGIPLYAGNYGQSLIIIKNGTPLVAGTDYSVSNNLVSLTSATATNDVFVINVLTATAARPPIFSLPYGDPNFANVTSLLHFNGNFTDVISGVTWTAAGSATTSTTNPKWGSESYDSIGDGTSKITSNSSGFSFGTADFTVECWVCPTSSANFCAFTFHTDFIVETSTGIWAIWDGTAPHVSAIPIVANVYHHVAITRASGTMRFFVDGVSAVTPWSFTTSISSTDMTIGRYATAVDSMPYIDDFRVTKGIARYTADFTPPLTQFADSA